MLHYDFDMLIMGRHARRLAEIYDQARAIGAGRIEVTGYSSATLLSDGHTMSEDASLADKRGREVAALLARAGLHDVRFEFDTARLEPQADGVDDWMGRRVSVVVAP